ncbi:MAG: transglutaminase domain-containing protein, partial [Clostridia bacterium]|nr:transglutaminase domain-containing protein [Clostridia bacterium]
VLAAIVVSLSARLFPPAGGDPADTTLSTATATTVATTVATTTVATTAATTTAPVTTVATTTAQTTAVATTAATTTAPVTTTATTTAKTTAVTTTTVKTTSVATTVATNTTAESSKSDLAIIPDNPAPRPILLEAEASGVLQKSNTYALIDYSNTSEGYVMVKFNLDTQKRIKAQLKGPLSTYTYNLQPGAWEVFPLSEGSGSYKLTVFQNVEGSKYSTVLSLTFTAELENDFGAFLYPNQYVNYSAAPNAVEKAYQLTKYLSSPLEKVAAIYDFTVDTLSYDYELASSVKSGYLPELDRVLEKKKGICFDYAALMAGMLRSQGIPCKLVVGYAGTAYHAWISVWTEDEGWVDGVIFFDGSSWHRMDPTYASSGDRSDKIMDYIGDGKNYTEKYVY